MIASYLSPPPPLTPRAAALYEEHLQRIYRRTDRLFAWLMAAQWASAIVLMVIRHMRPWQGWPATVHPHVWQAAVLGAALLSWPLYLSLRHPGAWLTRHVIAVAQMLGAALFIHLMDGRIEAHFCVFGSLAFLAFYRDWTVIVPATLVVAVDHWLRGRYWPQSIFGVAEAEPWRWIEHAGWILFQDAFLLVSCWQSQREMRNIAGHLAAQEQSQALIERAAQLDRLTGLMNRSRFLEVLQETIARARGKGWFDYAVLFLDCDRFKIINDSLGHHAGDQLLRDIARRLQKHLPPPASGDGQPGCLGAARLGGDEFVILLDGIIERDAALEFTDRLVSAFREPFALGKHEATTTISVGLVLADPRYERAEEVLGDADTAMYAAKRGGKNRSVLFDASMRENVLRRLRLERDLRAAAERGELSLQYQPIVSLRSGEVMSVEGLLRWRHAELGPISPAEFIPIAEESDTILALGDWVLRAGCRQMAEWIERLGDNAPPVVSLNLSRKQFRQTRLVERVLETVQNAGIDPRRLQLEITEDTFVSDVDAAIEAMQTLRSHGVKLAIDDFGSGCSTFASLHLFPADVLKVDRGLLAGVENSPDTAALVHALAVLVRNLGMTMVAEGIEQASQVIALQELGCHYGQGYFFAKPLPPDAVAEFLCSRGGPGASVGGAMAFANRWEKRLAVFETLSPE